MVFYIWLKLSFCLFLSRSHAQTNTQKKSTHDSTNLNKNFKNVSLVSKLRWVVPPTLEPRTDAFHKKFYVVVQMNCICLCGKINGLLISRASTQLLHIWIWGWNSRNRSKTYRFPHVLKTLLRENPVGRQTAGAAPRTMAPTAGRRPWGPTNGLQSFRCFVAVNEFEAAKAG